MAFKHDLLGNNLKFDFQSKFVGIPFCILLLLAYYTALFTYTTSTDEYKLERPTEIIQPDPVLLSLNISFAELQNVSSLAQSLIDDSNSPQALQNCTILLAFATYQLNQSIQLLTVGQGDHEMIVGTDIFAASLSIKTSLASQEKCLDGLEKMGSSTVLNDLRVRVQTSKQCTSNSSAILGEIYPLNFRPFRRRTCLFNYICVAKNL